MQQGLVWYEDDPKKSLLAVLEAAATRHHERFGCWPRVCHVAEGRKDIAWQDGRARVALTVGDSCSVVLTLVANKAIHPGYYWLGISEV